MQYGPALSVEGKRIFVFNRRILSDESKEPQRIKLLPYEVSKPELGTTNECWHSLMIRQPFCYVHLCSFPYTFQFVAQVPTGSSLWATQKTLPRCWNSKIISSSSLRSTQTNNPHSVVAWPVLTLSCLLLVVLNRSQCYEAYIQESYKSCKTSVAQHQVHLITVLRNDSALIMELNIGRCSGATGWNRRCD